MSLGDKRVTILLSSKWLTTRNGLKIANDRFYVINNFLKFWRWYSRNLKYSKWFSLRNKYSFNICEHVLNESVRNQYRFIYYNVEHYIIYYMLLYIIVWLNITMDLVPSKHIFDIFQLFWNMNLDQLTVNNLSLIFSSVKR